MEEGKKPAWNMALTRIPPLGQGFAESAQFQPIHEQISLSLSLFRSIFLV